MNNEEFLEIMNSGREVAAGSPVHIKMGELSERARRFTLELNAEYEAGRIREIFSQLTETVVDGEFRIFPPFYTDCGINIRVGRNVFINACCNMQDQGGIRIGSNVLIGHNVVIATLNHVEDPAQRASMRPAPVVIEDNVWIGSGAVLCPGVSIGYGAIIGAGAVVTRDVPAMSVAAGVPAHVLRKVKTAGPET